MVGVRARLVDLVDGDDDGHFGRLRMMDGLDGLRHDTVIGRDDEDGDIRDLGAARTHGRESLMARRVEEDDLLALAIDLVSTNMLRDSAGFVRLHMRVADAVEERRLAVVDMAHDRDDWRTELQALRIVLDFRNLRRIDIRRQLLAGDAELGRDERGRIEVDFLVDRRHDAHHEELFDDFGSRAAHLRREVFDCDGLRQLDVLRTCNLDLWCRLLAAIAAVVLAAATLIAAAAALAVAALAAALAAMVVVPAAVAAAAVAAVAAIATIAAAHRAHRHAHGSTAATTTFVAAAAIAATALAAARRRGRRFLALVGRRRRDDAQAHARQRRAEDFVLLFLRLLGLLRILSLFRSYFLLRLGFGRSFLLRRLGLRAHAAVVILAGGRICGRCRAFFLRSGFRFPRNRRIHAAISDAVVRDLRFRGLACRRLARVARNVFADGSTLRLADAREVVLRPEMMLLQDAEDLLRVHMELFCQFKNPVF